MDTAVSIYVAALPRTVVPLIPITFLVTFSSGRGRKLHNLPKGFIEKGF